jgi:uncharacterized iron-regulated protein
MRTFLRWTPVALVAACGGRAPSPVAPVALTLPDSVTVHVAASGAAIATPELLRRLGTADIVLLGELHDNPYHHRVRGMLITALASHHPAVVFEQFAASEKPIPPPSAGETREAWLDANGFDRTGWRWPLHAPVVEAALANGRAIWGSNVSREALRSVIREGASAAPPEFRRLMEQSPLDSAARVALDEDLIEGHCGQLPATMIPGMRAAQEVRDASMTWALVAAGATGPAWLIAGNGHVRSDIAVPRMLRNAATGKHVLVVGLLERGEDGTLPDQAERRRYDLVIVTPAAAREDPCARLRR